MIEMLMKLEKASQIMQIATKQCTSIEINCLTKQLFKYIEFYLASRAKFQMLANNNVNKYE